MIRSFVSAFVGWLAAVVALPVAGFAGHMIIAYSPQLLRDSLFLATIWILPVWLVLLWPLYVSVPYRSALWRPYICIPSGAIAGAILIAVPLPILLHGPHPYFYVGPFVGAVTCAVGCYLKAHEHPTSPNQAMQRNRWPLRVLVFS
jgi:hypothetical protein